jgi:hypothetical protein
MTTIGIDFVSAISKPVLILPSQLPRPFEWMDHLVENIGLAHYSGS